MRSKIVVGEREIEVPRARLRLWFELEKVLGELKEAAERGETARVADILCAYLSAASGEDETIFSSAPWFEVAVAFGQVTGMNALRIKFPLFRNTVSSKNEIPWDYENRSWYEWCHLLANAYGWTLEAISNLEIEDGIGLLQEILTEEQLQREWEWSLSQNSYEYVPSLKSSRFRPLQRPSWMQVDYKNMKPKTIKIRKDMLPQGLIVDLNSRGTAVH